MSAKLKHWRKQFMKQGKKLTLAQRKYLDSIGLQSSEWLLVKKLQEVWTLEHRLTGQAKEIYAPTK